MKRIGVLGGISAQATIDFEARVHRVSQREIPQHRNAGYPPMVVWYHRRLPIRVDAGIMALMEGREGAGDAEAARAAVARPRSHGVDGVVLGCTEIPLLLGDEAEAKDVVNPVALLAEATVHFAAGEGRSAV